MRFIDWLSVIQDHPEGGLPVVGNEMVVKYDLETGDVIRKSPNMKTVEGSYSSTMTIRSDGTRVTVEGNPSRWHRSDNLFGLQSFDDCMQVYNSILLKFGLPPFTKCTRFWYLQGEDGKSVSKVSDGAMFRRVDWTRNLAVGKGNVTPFLKALSTQTLGKGFTPYLYPNGHTLDWISGKKRNNSKARGSTLWYQKLYNKAEDLRLTLTERGKKINKEHELYLKKLIAFCNEQGVVRDEKEFKRAFLNRKNLCFYGMTKESEFTKYLGDIETIIERLEMSTVDYETIADQLIDKKIVKARQAANATQGVVFAWLHGQQIPKTSAFYVHRSRLLELGVDISVPHDVTKSIPQLKRQREITVSTLLPPPWYQIPRTNNLRLAS